MPERHPGWVSGINDFEARLATGLFTTSELTSDPLDPLRVRSGIRDAGGNPGLVTLGTNQVTVNPFQAVIQDPARPALGPYLVTLDAPKNLQLTASDPSLGRIDLVIAEIDPAVEPGFVVQIVEGEPAATPAPPTVPNPLHLTLARIQIPAGTTTPTLIDTRQFTAALGGILPVRGSADLPANAAGSMFVYRLDTRVLQVRQGNSWVTYRPPRGSVDTWHAPTFQNGWTNYSSTFTTAAYTITEDGWVRLRGLVKGGTINTAIFTLPTGYRPTATHLFTASTYPNAYCRIDVRADGQVVAATGNNTWVALDNLAFATY